MKKKFGILAALILSVGLDKAYAQSEIKCSGDIILPASKFVSSADISFLSLDVGQWLGLSNPITSDTDNYVGLIIQSVHKSHDSIQVMAASFNPGIQLFFEFRSKNGKIRLVDFKGFEGPTAFGPATLTCE